MAVKFKGVLRLDWDHTKAVEGITGTFPVSFAHTYDQASGTGADQQDQMWYDKGRTLAASASETLDLAGSLSDPFGDTITFAKIKGLYVRNRNTAAGDTLVIGGNSSNDVPLFDNVSDSITLGPGAIFYWADPSAAGKTVTAGTGDLLKLAESGGANTVTFDIAIWGTTA